MTNTHYNDLLKRVHSATAKERIEDDRFKVPKVDVFYEGNTTVLKNFDKIIDVLNRDADHFLKFLLGSVGTAGDISSGRVIFQGKIPIKTIQDRLDEYVDTYVICSECNRPDTHLVKKDRTLLIRCDACGAFRSIGSMKKRKTIVSTEIFKEGETYELTIKDIGKRGDGVAFFDKYVVYIPGAIKGATVKVKIEKISGTVAFGRIVP
ncbi:MAG: translation initiation factor IF-2 subunit beta [Candidatus Thermoplasmatota archaeon]|nr:translation initiation factor IF-2 subunit beta [Candidatus Thermoplasmatota archaeon]